MLEPLPLCVADGRVSLESLGNADAELRTDVDAVLLTVIGSAVHDVHGGSCKGKGESLASTTPSISEQPTNGRRGCRRSPRDHVTTVTAIAAG